MMIMMSDPRSKRAQHFGFRPGQREGPGVPRSCWWCLGKTTAVHECQAYQSRPRHRAVGFSSKEAGGGHENGSPPSPVGLERRLVVCGLVQVITHQKHKREVDNCTLHKYQLQLFKTVMTSAPDYAVNITVHRVMTCEELQRATT